jgi:hypothetical protein
MKRTLSVKFLYINDKQRIYSVIKGLGLKKFYACSCSNPNGAYIPYLLSFCYIDGNAECCTFARRMRLGKVEHKDFEVTFQDEINIVELPLKNPETRAAVKFGLRGLMEIWDRNAFVDLSKLCATIVINTDTDGICEIIGERHAEIMVNPDDVWEIGMSVSPEMAFIRYPDKRDWS